MPLTDLANPSRFLAFVDAVLPWLAAATLLAFGFGVAQVYLAPDDYQQGATVKIMFIHVPSMWLSMATWGVMSIAALGTLVWRHPLADVAAKAAAPIGAAFTLLGLIGAALTVALRRGGLLLAILVLPLSIPVLIFGVAAANAAIVGPVPFGTPFTILCALTLISIVIGPFAAAVALRQGLD